jgi:hypothetical protein
MTERRPRSQPRDAAHRARYVETLEGTAGPNVEGRRVVGPLQGFGKMWQKTYTARLEGSSASPAEVVGAWRERFPELSGFGERGFRVPSGGLVPGAVALLGDLSGVMVLYSDEESFTYITPEGHPFSGWISFSAHADEDGTTVARAYLLIRANDPLYELMMPLGLHNLEDRTWQRTLRNVAAHFGANAVVETRIVCVDPRRQWRRYKNIRHNALVLSALRAITTPLRRTKRRLRASTRT